MIFSDPVEVTLLASNNKTDWKNLSKVKSGDYPRRRSEEMVYTIANEIKFKDYRVIFKKKKGVESNNAPLRIGQFDISSIYTTQVTNDVMWELFMAKTAISPAVDYGEGIKIAEVINPEPEYTLSFSLTPSETTLDYLSDLLLATTLENASDLDGYTYGQFVSWFGIEKNCHQLLTRFSSTANSNIAFNTLPSLTPNQKNAIKAISVGNKIIIVVNGMSQTMDSPLLTRPSFPKLNFFWIRRNASSHKSRVILEDLVFNSLTLKLPDPFKPELEGICINAEGSTAGIESRTYVGKADDKDKCLNLCIKFYHGVAAGSRQDVSGCQYDANASDNCFIYDKAIFTVSKGSGESSTGSCWPVRRIIGHAHDGSCVPANGAVDKNQPRIDLGSVENLDECRGYCLEYYHRPITNRAYFSGCQYDTMATICFAYDDPNYKVRDVRQDGSSSDSQCMFSDGKVFLYSYDGICGNENGLTSGDANRLILENKNITKEECLALCIEAFYESTDNADISGCQYSDIDDGQYCFLYHTKLFVAYQGNGNVESICWTIAPKPTFTIEYNGPNAQAEPSVEIDSLLLEDRLPNPFNPELQGICINFDGTATSKESRNYIGDAASKQGCLDLCIAFYHTIKGGSRQDASGCQYDFDGSKPNSCFIYDKSIPTSLKGSGEANAGLCWPVRNIVGDVQNGNCVATGSAVDGSQTKIDLGAAQSNDECRGFCLEYHYRPTTNRLYFSGCQYDALSKSCFAYDDPNYVVISGTSNAFSNNEQCMPSDAKIFLSEHEGICIDENGLSSGNANRLMLTENKFITEEECHVMCVEAFYVIADNGNVTGCQYNTKDNGQYCFLYNSHMFVAHQGDGDIKSTCWTTASKPTFTLEYQTGDAYAEPAVTSSSVISQNRLLNPFNPEIDGICLDRDDSTTGFQSRTYTGNVLNDQECLDSCIKFYHNITAGSKQDISGCQYSINDYGLDNCFIYAKSNFIAWKGSGEAGAGSCWTVRNIIGVAQDGNCVSTNSDVDGSQTRIDLGNAQSIEECRGFCLEYHYRPTTNRAYFSGCQYDAMSKSCFAYDDLNYEVTSGTPDASSNEQKCMPIASKVFMFEHDGICTDDNGLTSSDTNRLMLTENKFITEEECYILCVEAFYEMADNGDVSGCQYNTKDDGQYCFLYHSPMFVTYQGDGEIGSTCWTRASKPKFTIEYNGLNVASDEIVASPPSSPLESIDLPVENQFPNPFSARLEGICLNADASTAAIENRKYIGNAASKEECLTSCIKFYHNITAGIRQDVSGCQYDRGGSNPNSCIIYDKSIFTVSQVSGELSTALCWPIRNVIGDVQNGNCVATNGDGDGNQTRIDLGNAQSISECRGFCLEYHYRPTTNRVYFLGVNMTQLPNYALPTTTQTIKLQAEHLMHLVMNTNACYLMPKYSLRHTMEFVPTKMVHPAVVRIV